MHDFIPMQKPQGLQHTPKHLFGDVYRNWFFVRVDDVVEVGLHERKYQAQRVEFAFFACVGTKEVEKRNAIAVLRFTGLFVDAYKCR